jgi:hypothetical protein
MRNGETAETTNLDSVSPSNRSRDLIKHNRNGLLGIDRPEGWESACQRFDEF